MVSPPSP
ncbi:hypothetical protein ECPA25_5791, partial [Escherichia coli PA25]